MGNRKLKDASRRSGSMDNLLEDKLLLLEVRILRNSKAKILFRIICRFFLFSLSFILRVE